MTATAGYHYPFNDSSTEGTGLPLTTVNSQLVLKATLLTQTINIIAETGTLHSNTCLQNSDKLAVQVSRFLGRQVPGRALRVYTRSKEALIGVDIADTGNVSLIQ